MICARLMSFNLGKPPTIETYMGPIHTPLLFKNQTQIGRELLFLGETTQDEEEAISVFILKQ